MKIDVLRVKHPTTVMLLRDFTFLAIKVDDESSGVPICLVLPDWRLLNTSFLVPAFERKLF